MQLRAYLDRIGFAGDPQPDMASLKALHRAHLAAIPYENLDVQLGRPVITDPAGAYARIVGRGRRGGWCYEMNGLFGWALAQVGFRVTRLAGGVVRELVGDEMVGNHLVLRVDLPEGPWIADVGFGDGPVEAYPLRDGAFVQRGFTYGLTELGDGWWRLSNHPEGGARSFDFRAETADEALLSRQCAFLQSSDRSPFTQNLICQRPVDGAVMQLRGRVLRTVRPDSFDEHLIGTEAEFVRVLADIYGIEDPDLPRLWAKVCERHAQVFA
jgi:N-hydroxyarylamine O-acetyltransferase